MRLCKVNILRGTAIIYALALGTTLGPNAHAQLYDEKRVAALCTPAEERIVVDIFNKAQMAGILAGQGRGQESINLTFAIAAEAKKLSPKCNGAFPQRPPGPGPVSDGPCTREQIRKSEEFNAMVQYPNHPKPCPDF
jgi:hypothetical protein